MLKPNQDVIIVKEIRVLIMGIIMDLIMVLEEEEVAAEVEASEEILSSDKWQITGWMSLVVIPLQIQIANLILKMVKNKKKVNKKPLTEAAISVLAKKDQNGLKTVLSSSANHLRMKKLLMKLEVLSLSQLKYKTKPNGLGREVALLVF